jgi:hypothetical protein
MTTEYGRVDLTPKQSTTTHHASYTINRPGSPLKQEVGALPDLESAMSEYMAYISPSTTTTTTTTSFTRRNRAFDQTHRWTVLAREAEADEVSILSVTSEEKGYYTSLPADVPHNPSATEGVVNRSRPGSGFSGFIQEAFAEHEPDEIQNTQEESTEPFNEINETVQETIQFSALPQLSPLVELPPTEPPPYNAL